MNKFNTAVGIAALATFVMANTAFASTQQSFTSCLTPTGEVKASYASGTHGIAGDTSLHSGADTVYTLGNGNLMQCFCGTDGAGIQTNWMNAGDLSEDQIKIYESQGWIYIPNGTAWGLTEDPYLAQNVNYSCGGSSTTNSGGGDTHGDGLTDGRTDGRSDGLGSIVQAAKGSAGLASTGNITFVLSILGVGIFLTLVGLFMRKNTK